MSKEEQRYYEKFNYLITISEICKNVFLELVPSMADRMSVVENMIDVKAIKNKLKKKAEFSNWNGNRVQLVTVGRLEQPKGIDLGVCACKILCDRGKEICWHVYGEGSQRESLQKMIEENRLSNSFILEGMVINPYPYMGRADIIVQPSRHEGKSIVLDEAKILGKAIVVTNYTSVADQITDKESGLIVECTPEGIAKGVEKLIDDNVMKITLEKNNSETADQNEQILYKFYQILEM